MRFYTKISVYGILIVNKLHYSFKYKNKQVYAIEKKKRWYLAFPFAYILFKY